MRAPDLSFYLPKFAVVAPSAAYLLPYPLSGPLLHPLASMVTIAYDISVCIARRLGVQNAIRQKTE